MKDISVYQSYSMGQIFTTHFSPITHESGDGLKHCFLDMKLYVMGYPAWNVLFRIFPMF